jgi:cell wall-associated NlpC family hydrolase
MPTLTGLIAPTLGAVLVLPVLAFGALNGLDPACQTGSATTPAATTATAGPSGAWSSPATFITSTTSATVTDAAVAATWQASTDTPVWDSEQLANAATIVTVGRSKNVPPWGWVIAVATAIQESRLRNLPGGDRDSIGLFQQRPSAGWGTPAQLASPTYQAGKFYDALLTVPDWQRLPLTDAAQAVQRSAFPGAYAQWTQAAVRLVTLAGSPNSRATPGDLTQFFTSPGCPPSGGDGQPGGGAGVSLPAGFALPARTPPAVATAIGWALAQRGTPYSWGGDCTAAHSGVTAHECDCSSLVQMAYRAASIALPRTTGEQVRAGVPVQDLSQIRPGDLVFIPGADGTPSAPGHVALYIGDDLAVHAPHHDRQHPAASPLTTASSALSCRRVACLSGGILFDSGAWTSQGSAGLTPGSPRWRAQLKDFAAQVFAGLPRSDQRATGLWYLRELMLDGQPKSMQPMAERRGVDYQQVQQFVTSSTWDATGLRLTWHDGGGAVTPQVWVVDDTGFPKDGKAVADPQPQPHLSRYQTDCRPITLPPALVAGEQRAFDRYVPRVCGFPRRGRPIRIPATRCVAAHVPLSPAIEDRQAQAPT